MCLDDYLHCPPQNGIFIASVFITLKQNSAVFSDINSTDSLQIYHGYRKSGQLERKQFSKCLILVFTMYCKDFFLTKTNFIL